MIRRLRSINIKGIRIIPIWSDSLGAKSFSVFVDTGDVRAIIDPGASIMHPSFPLDESDKFRYLMQAKSKIRKYMNLAKVIIITHYHYDHYFPSDVKAYEGKIILAKNPNEYINESQRIRAVDFFNGLFKELTGGELRLQESNEIVDKEYEVNLPIAFNMDFGDYNSRRRELLERGKRWFKKIANKWMTWKKIPSFKESKVEVRFIDNESLRFGGTLIRFSEPLFHGIEFSKLGWVISVIIEKKGVKILYTSDINGPIIEDYAEWIVRENPDILFIDGPATYMIPYSMNMINFRRSIKNIYKIIKNINAKIIFLDHHITRDPRYRIRLREIYEQEKKIMTFAEFNNEKTLADEIYEMTRGTRR